MFHHIRSLLLETSQLIYNLIKLWNHEFMVSTAIVFNAALCWFSKLLSFQSQTDRGSGRALGAGSPWLTLLRQLNITPPHSKQRSPPFTGGEKKHHEDGRGPKGRDVRSVQICGFRAAVKPPMGEVTMTTPSSRSLLKETWAWSLSAPWEGGGVLPCRTSQWDRTRSELQVEPS